MSIVPDPTQKTAEHPTWCFEVACDFAEGGEHASNSRLIPADGPNPLLVDLVQRPGGKTRLRLTCGQAEVLLPLRNAKNLGAVLNALAMAGRRAER